MERSQRNFLANPLQASLGIIILASKNLITLQDVTYFAQDHRVIKFRHKSSSKACMFFQDTFLLWNIPPIQMYEINKYLQSKYPQNHHADHEIKFYKPLRLFYNILVSGSWCIALGYDFKEQQFCIVGSMCYVSLDLLGRTNCLL